MTSEERSKYPLCGARKKNGERCRAFAGQGTDHKGVGACKNHGGSTPAHKKHAAKVKTEREMVTYGDAIDVTPLEALKGILRATAGHVAWCKARIEVLDGIESPEARVLVQQYGEERDRLARVAKACLDTGMKQTEIEMVERQTAYVGELLEAVLAELELTPAQRKQVGPAIRKQIPAVTGSDAAADEALEPVLV